MFVEPQVHYLGHIISATGVSIDNDKITTILDWKPPTTATRLRGFFGLTGYYHWFVHNYASIVAPLTYLLQTYQFHYNETVMS